MLENREPHSRMRAISTLARVAPNDIAPIASIAATDEDADVRHHAIATLGEMGGPAVHDGLVGLLDGGDRATRLAVVRAMRAAGDRRAVDAFISLAADDDPELRQSAPAALAYLLEAHRSSMFPARLREVVDDDAIDRVITAIADGAPDESWVASLNIRPRSLAKRACALTRERHRS